MRRIALHTHRNPVLSCAIALALLCCAAAGDEKKAAEKALTEPTISHAEAAAIREAKKLAGTDPAAAAVKLRSHLTEKSSAALDFSLGVILTRSGKLD